ncbi:hypothetical protein BDF20DRAFT_321074 [Mycotypha africana]|uniref:uncharacterized protein n=1 Tax=Mycotypha africana TaxID=64632 RepID=UPI00230125A8|nr:uncharacterized protein BDF20DRAFT_321074 [Mycotypha africana]KAI8988321.1 hypothetical protein BDF20DRAFT_321074 [Mycotypha africana]
MGTTKSRKSRRNNSRPTAFSFLSNIVLGSENEKPPDDPSIRKPSNYLLSTKTPISVNPATFQSTNVDHLQDVENIENSLRATSLHSSDSSFSGDDDNFQASLSADPSGRSYSSTSAPIIAANNTIDYNQKGGKNQSYHSKRHSSDSSSEDVEHHKLTREDSEKPIASEKIKKRSTHADRDHGHGSSSNMSIMAVLRYYTDKLRQSTYKKQPSDTPANRSYIQQQLQSHDHSKHRKALSYAHFLNPTGSLLDDQTIEENLGSEAYDPYFLDNDKYNNSGVESGSMGTMANTTKPSEIKREVNEQFRLDHPELSPEITLSKIRSIKLHLLEIAKKVDLEISSVAHAYVFFEKLVIKNMVTKKNRKLIAACCLFLATKVNEAKGTWFGPLLDAIDDEFNVDAEEIHEHEFAVFADLEFNLYVPCREFMPHFERIFNHLEYKSIQDYLGNSSFYEVNQHL